jgi:hypothetical protein
MKGRPKSVDSASDAEKARIQLQFDELSSRTAAAYANVPEDEGMRLIDAAAREVRRERRESANAGRTRS